MSDNTVLPRSPGRHLLEGSAWMIGLRWAIRLTGLVSTVILARLLVPADFGIVAMAMLVVGMLELLSQSGQKLAIIRHQNPGRDDYDTAWTVSVLVGMLIAGAILVVAPFTPAYFHEPRAVPVMQCLALRAAMGGFENIGIVDFRRELRFDRFFLYNMGPKLASVVVTISLAFLWRNYWALVAGILSGQFAMVATSYAMHAYRPRFSLARLREIYAFSGWTLFRTAGLYFNSKADEFAVGGVLGAGAMGRYSVGADFAASPLEEINAPMVAVLYPVMSRLQNDGVRLRELYLRTLAWSGLICASVSVGITLIAHDFTILVLGPKWLAVEPLIGWLALSAGLLGLSSGAYAIFDVIGKPHLGARMQWTRLIMLVVVLAPVAWLMRDLQAIAIVRFVVTGLFVPTLFVAVSYHIGVSSKEYWEALWRPSASAAVMALLIFVVNRQIDPGNFRLAADIVLGATFFTAALLCLWFLGGRPATSPEGDVMALCLRFFKCRALPQRPV